MEHLIANPHHALLAGHNLPLQRLNTDTAELAVFADEDDSRLSARIRLLVEDLRAEWRQLDAWIAAFDAEFARPRKTRRRGGWR